MSKLNIRKQLGLLYISNFMFNISIAGAAWVLLLVSDGYSLIQVGLAETVFHAVSLCAEIPSGMFADVMGRKKSLIVSCVMSMLSAIVRGFIPGFAAVCASVGFAALSYNFISGSDMLCLITSYQEATARLLTIRFLKKGRRVSTTSTSRHRRRSTGYRTV